MFVQNITRFDAAYGSSASSRDVLVSIDYASGLYNVTLTISHRKTDGTLLGTKSVTWNYSVVPSVYILYKPLSDSDTIKIENKLSDSTLIKDIYTGEKDYVNVYLINQKDAASGTYYKSVLSDNVKLTEQPDGIKINTYTLTNLADISKSDTLASTILYTNMKTGADKNDTINGPVKMKKIETIYNLNVNVKFDGKEVSTFNSTKTVSD